MKNIAVAIVLCFAIGVVEGAELRAKVQSNADVDDLVKHLRRQLSERGHNLTVTLDDSYDVRIVGISEGSLAGAQGTIVVLSRSCDVLTAVTRSGRMTSGGAFNAAAKEVVKRLESIGALDQQRDEDKCS